MSVKNFIINNDALIGAISGLGTGVVLQPLEVIKVCLIVTPAQQVAAVTTTNATRSFSPLATSIKLIYEKGGVRGFWKGLSPALFEMVSGSAVYFKVLHQMNKDLKYLDLERSKSDFLSSSIARVASTFVSNPFAVIRTRVQIPGFTEYSSVLDGVRKIYAIEGMRGFFKGTVACMIKDVPFAGLYYAFMNKTKEYLKPLHLSGPSSTMVSGMISGMIATGITHPMEVIRTIIQVDSSVQVKYDGIWTRLSRIWVNDGPKGLFKGLAPRLVKKPLANTLSFIMFEMIKKPGHH